MYYFFYFILLCLPTALWGDLPQTFSLKPIKNFKEVLLEYPEDHPFGRVEMETKENYKYFYYTDLDGRLVALGKADADFHQDIVEVYDAHSNLLGVIERSGRALSSQSSYTVFDAENHQVATGSMNLLGTRLYFSSSDKKKDLALFYRPFFQLIGDYWYTKVGDRDGIDERLLVMIGAVQSTLITKSDSILGT